MNDPPYVEREGNQITTCKDCAKLIYDDESYAKVTNWWGLTSKDLCIVCYNKWQVRHKRK